MDDSKKEKAEFQVSKLPHYILFQEIKAKHSGEINDIIEDDSENSNSFDSEEWYE